MKEKLKKLILIVCIFAILFIQFPVKAENSYVYSVRAQKIPVDKNLKDYSDAELITLNANLFSKQMYIKNSETNLFIAIRVEINQSLEGLGLIFDVDHDQQFAEDVKVLFANQNKSDGYFYLNSALSIQSQTFFSGAVSTITYIDGKTYKLYEFNIAFNPNSSPTTDMYISDPSDYMLGFDLVEIRNGSLYSWSRGDLGSETSINKLDSNASTFFTMVLAGPGKFAVPDFNPVVSSSTQQPGSQTSSTEINGQKNDQTESYSATAATPGFEFMFLLVAMGALIIFKKINLRRQNK